MRTAAALISLPLLLLVAAAPAASATRVWTGAVDNQWSTAGNWLGGLPVAGDDLVFPAAANQTNTNDLPPGTAFRSITVTGGSYVIGGNLIALSNGLVGQYPATVNIDLPLRLTAPQTLEFPYNSLGGVSGAVDLNGHDLTIIRASVSGVISGSGNVTLSSVILTADNTYTGTTFVEMYCNINGSQPQSAVIVRPGTGLGGIGVLGNLTAYGDVAPGAGVPGILGANNVAFGAGSSFSVRVDGPAPGAGHSQLRVKGNLTIAPATNLFVTLGASYAPAAGSVVVLIDNDGVDPVNGTFGFKPEGTVLTFPGAGRFRLSYAGGTGNDVTLTLLEAPYVWTGATSSLWSAAGNWAGGVAPTAGSELLFPLAALNTTNTNDLPAATAFASLTFNDNYTIGGNQIALSNGFVVQTAGVANVNLPVRLTAPQTFDFQSSGSSIGGAIDLNGHDLLINGWVTDVTGVISGSGNITLIGVATTADNTYTGSTTVRTHARIDGSQPSSAVTVESPFGLLYGTTGVLGNLTVNGKVEPGPTIVCPCPSDNGSGIVMVRNLALNASSHYSVNVNGAGPGSGYDQLRANGTVTIHPSASLDVLLNPSYAPAFGSEVVLIDNDGADPVSGTFAGKPEASVLDFGTTVFVLSYAGGDGNDVTLRCGPLLAIGDVNLAEGDAGPATASFSVTLSPPATALTTVSWATTAGTAAAGTDYVTSSGTLAFNVGESVKTLDVTVNGDTPFELDETFFVTLSMPGGALIADGVGVGTILNDDPTPILGIDDVVLAEGNAGATIATFTATLSPASGAQATVWFSTSNATASFTSDYVAASGTLTFAPGETTKSIAVTVNGDTLLEPVETFHVDLSGVSQASIGDGQGVGTIVNDDLPPARVFVSGAGLDVNDCSNVATPCRTLNGAIAQVAEDGEVIVTRSGSYAGATITKSVKVHAASGVVAFSGQPMTVNSGAGTRVVLRGLTLKAVNPGTGSGILIQSAGAVFVENTVIDGWDVGIRQQGAAEAFVKGSAIRNNNTGIQATTGHTTIDSARLTNNATGIDAEAAEVSMRGSTLSGNTTAGLSAGNDSSVTVEKCQIANNGTGITLPAASLATVWISRSIVSGNNLGLENVGGTLLLSGTNVVRGNAVDTSGVITTTGLQ